ncbi:MAG: hypothetical protein ACFFB3_17265 [Candidatus Hodarchaeota archaeon]
MEFGYHEMQAKAKKTLKFASSMNLVRTQLRKALGCEQSWGYLTKYQRTQSELPKSHVHDALAIASGTTYNSAEIKNLTLEMDDGMF